MNYDLDQTAIIDIAISNPSTSVAQDADSAPTWKVFENDSTSSLLNGSFVKRGTDTGIYTAAIVLSSANGFSKGKSYTVVATATVEENIGKCIVKNININLISVSEVDNKIDIIDTNVDGVKSKTDNLPASPAAVGSAMTLEDDAITASKIEATAITEIQSGLATSGAVSTIDSNVTSIKSKTDNLPASPAATGDAMTLEADQAVNVTKVAGFAVSSVDDFKATGFTTSSDLTTIDSNVTLIKSKTDNLPSSPAAVGSAMTLADNAITSAKLEATAVTEIQSGLATSSALSTVDSNVSAIKAKTDNLPASPAAVGSAMTLAADQAVNVTKVAGSSVTGVSDFKATGFATPSDMTSALVAYDSPTKTEMDAAFAALNDIAASDVWAVSGRELSTPDNYKADLTTVLSNLTTLLTRISDTRAAYFDKLNITGNVANQTSVTDVQTTLANATYGLSALQTLITTIDIVADAIKAVTDNLPDSGLLSNLSVNVNTIKNQALSTMAAENFEFFFNNNDSTTAKYVDQVGTADSTGDGTAPTVTEIRTELEKSGTILYNLNTRLTDTRSGYLDKLNITGNVADQTSIIDVKAVVDGIKIKTDNLPAAPAAVGSAMTLAADQAVNVTKVAGAAVSGVSDFKATGFATSSALSTVDSNVSAIKAKTDNLPASPAATGDEMTLAADQAVNVTKVAGAAVSGVSDFKATGFATSSALSTVDSNVSAIKAKTDNLPASPAAVGSQMTLTDDAITSDKLAASAVSEIQSGLATAAVLSTVNTNAASIKSTVENATYGLSALKTLADTNQLENQTDLTSIESKIDTVDNVVDNINSDIDSGTYGLSAIKTAVNTNASNISTVDSKVTTINSNVNTINTNVSSVTYGLPAIKNSVDDNQLDLASVESKIDTINSNVSSVKTSIDSTSFGLSRLKTLIDNMTITIDTNATDTSSIISISALIKAVTDKLNTAVELDGAVYKFTTNALENAPCPSDPPTVAQIVSGVMSDSNIVKLLATSFGRVVRIDTTYVVYKPDESGIAITFDFPDGPEGSRTIA